MEIVAPTIDDIEWIHVDEILNSWLSCDSQNIEVEATELTYKEWQVLLQNKRRDTCQYERALNFLKTEGFRFPSCYYYPTESPGTKCHEEGHHRLAAAIDLGFKYIPYLEEYTDKYCVGYFQWQNLVHPKNPIFENP